MTSTRVRLDSDVLHCTCYSFHLEVSHYFQYSVMIEILFVPLVDCTGVAPLRCLGRLVAHWLRPGIDRGLI